MHNEAWGDPQEPRELLPWLATQFIAISQIKEPTPFTDRFAHRAGYDRFAGAGRNVKNARLVNVIWFFVPRFFAPGSENGIAGFGLVIA